MFRQKVYINVPQLCPVCRDSYEMQSCHWKESHKWRHYSGQRMGLCFPARFHEQEREDQLQTYRQTCKHYNNGSIIEIIMFNWTNSSSQLMQSSRQFLYTTANLTDCVSVCFSVAYERPQFFSWSGPNFVCGLLIASKWSRGSADGLCNVRVPYVGPVFVCCRHNWVP